MVTLRPRDLRRKAMEAEVIPLPIPEITPPETNIYFDILEKLFEVIEYSTPI